MWHALRCVGKWEKDATWNLIHPHKQSYSMLVWVWNSLPAELRAPDISLDMFRNKLKTFLYNMQPC